MKRNNYADMKRGNQVYNFQLRDFSRKDAEAQSDFLFSSSLKTAMILRLTVCAGNTDDY
jgi:hypothetical protein